MSTKPYNSDLSLEPYNSNLFSKQFNSSDLSSEPYNSILFSEPITIKMQQTAEAELNIQQKTKETREGLRKTTKFHSIKLQGKWQNKK